MSSFGDKLRQERTSRGVSLDEIAGATGVDRVYLEALEENRFELLTGPAFGKLYVRAYAAVLGFDPEALIEDYDRERYGRGREEPSTTKVQLPPASEEAETGGNGAKPAQAAGDDADSTVPGEPAAAGPAEPPLALPESPAGIPVEPPGVRPVEPDEPMVETKAPRVVPPTGPRSLLTLVVTAFVALGLVLALAWAVRSGLRQGRRGP